MAYWFGRFSLFDFGFIKFLCWNVCWLLDAGFMAFLQPDLRFMVPLGVIWHAWCLYLGVLGTLGRSWDDPGLWDVGGHKEGPCELQAWILLIFCWFSGPILRVVWVLFDKKRSFCSHLFPGCFFWWFVGLNLGVWDCKNKHLARDVLQKSTFAEIGFLMIPGSIFHDFGWPLDQFSWFLLPWKLARHLMTFQGDSGIIPDPETEPGWG